MDKLAYNITEFCKVTGLGKTTAFQLIKTGEVVRIKVGGRTLISASSTVAFLNRCEG